MNREIWDVPIYGLSQEEKEEVLLEKLVQLTNFHSKNCKQYHKILEILGQRKSYESIEQIPFLPVRLFKEMDLASVPAEAIIKTMTSSGTSGQQVSKIFCDRQTAQNQQKALVKIVSEFTGKSRMPMLIIDCPSVVKNRNLFSARGAGILGFSIFGANRTYALTDEMQLDTLAIEQFLEKHKGKEILLFGFTFMVWQHFYKELQKQKKETGKTYDFSNARLIHGGGWKKLQKEAVTEEEFKQHLYDICGIAKIHDYYGMVEQTGSIYMECEEGHLHASVFSDIVIRNPYDFSVAKPLEEGIIQVVSSLPESYPGHSLLTEDLGRLLGVDTCPCGRKGKYFKVLGRIKEAEVRGCSDTYASDFTRG